MRNGDPLNAARAQPRLRRHNGRVSDTGPGLADAASAGVVLPAPQNPGGRGLWMVRRLAAVRIDTDPHGTVITAAVPLP